MNHSMKSPVFWFTPKWPFPATDGARIANVALLQASARILAKSGIQVTLISFCDEVVSKKAIEHAKVVLGVHDVLLLSKPVFKRGPSWGKWLVRFIVHPFRAVTFGDYDTRRSRAIFKKYWKSQGRPQSCSFVFDGLHPSALFFRAGKFHFPTEVNVFYRAHNVEAELWRQSAERQKNPILRCFLKFQFHWVQCVERALICKSKATGTVSEEDKQRLLQVLPQACVQAIPIASAPLDAFALPFSSGPLRLLFLGKLDWRPNREGLEWFLREVFPAVRAQRKEIELEIAGSGNGNWLDSYRSTEGVFIRGFVEEVTDAYRQTHCMVVPIFTGSGTRVKAIEAAAWGRSCLGTPLGLEGIGFTHGVDALLGETAQEWIQILVQLEPHTCAELASQARNTYVRRFDAGVIAERWVDLLLNTSH